MVALRVTHPSLPVQVISPMLFRVGQLPSLLEQAILFWIGLLISSPILQQRFPILLVVLLLGGSNYLPVQGDIFFPLGQNALTPLWVSGLPKEGSTAPALTAPSISVGAV